MAKKSPRMEFKLSVPNHDGLSQKDLHELIHRAIVRGSAKLTGTKITRVRKVTRSADTGRFATKKAAKAAPDKHIGE